MRTTESGDLVMRGALVLGDVMATDRLVTGKGQTK